MRYLLKGVMVLAKGLLRIIFEVIEELLVWIIKKIIIIVFILAIARALI